MKVKNNALIFAIIIVIALKVAYTQADLRDLLFILYPTELIVATFSGSISVYLPDGGYFHPEENMIIQKSCSGFNFLIINFITYYTTCNLHFKSATKKWLSIPICLFGSYILTVVVNASRILIAISLAKTNFFKGNLAHEIQGTFVYLFFILGAYILLKNHLNKTKNENIASA
ncbi:exosortase K [Nubsella zeaxanthinifaciens]|uniref:exosortase K n=1 Tax=Nubsella zeaxanthinifaciens TaxID=392412 RepID=UPI003CFD8BD5